MLQSTAAALTLVALILVSCNTVYDDGADSGQIDLKCAFEGQKMRVDYKASMNNGSTCPPYQTTTVTWTWEASMDFEFGVRYFVSSSDPPFVTTTPCSGVLTTSRTPCTAHFEVVCNNGFDIQGIDVREDVAFMANAIVGSLVQQYPGGELCKYDVAYHPL